MIPQLVSIIGAEKASYLLFGLSQILFPISFIYVNENKFNPIETNLIRGAGVICLNFIIARYYKMNLDYKYDVNFYNLMKRNIIMVLHGLAFANAQFYLPLPIVHTIGCSAPIYIFILDYYENGVRASRGQIISLVIGILGIICTIND
jgi:drug/metabolite transporter (DMT)-like permease